MLDHCKRWPRACNDNCADSYREDRRHGLIYGPCQDTDGTPISWAHLTTIEQSCIYCRADLPESGSVPAYRR